MKNCGHRFHVQVANRDFIDGVLVKIISPKANPPTIVQDKVLSLIQVLERSLYLLFLNDKILLLHIFFFFAFTNTLHCRILNQVGTTCATSHVLHNSFSLL